MQRLTGLDAMFLNMETPSSPMHVSSLTILEPSTAPHGFSFEQVRDLYAERLDQAPPFRRRLVEVPFDIDHPVWIEDPDFDIDWHLRHIAVPQPGTMGKLTELVGHLIAMPLDRSRPLWEIWLIDGLEGGNVGLLSKVHHAAIDGASGHELMVAILDLSPEIEQKPGPDVPWHADKVPTDTQLMGHAAVSLAQSPVRTIKAARRTVEAVLQIRSTNRKPDVTPPPSPFSAPRTSFNHALTSHRVFATANLSLAEAKRVKNAFGVTMNDVIVTLCGSALRHYLDGRDEHPDGPLVAMVPISVRGDELTGTMGNQLSSALATLATDVDDPVERLLAVHDGMLVAKEQQHAIGADTLQNWAELAAPAVAGRAARFYSRMKIADRHRPLFNVSISNVPGPPFPLFLAGRAGAVQLPDRTDLRRWRPQHDRDLLPRLARLRAQRLPRAHSERVGHRREPAPRARGPARRPPTSKGVDRRCPPTRGAGGPLTRRSPRPTRNPCGARRTREPVHCGWGTRGTPTKWSHLPGAAAVSSCWRKPRRWFYLAGGQ